MYTYTPGNSGRRGADQRRKKKKKKKDDLEGTHTEIEIEKFVYSFSTI
jgi:hypothetical protein